MLETTEIDVNPSLYTRQSTIETAHILPTPFFKEIDSQLHPYIYADGTVVHATSELLTYLYKQDKDTGVHSERVGRDIARVASRLGFNEREIGIATIAGLLHDSGKSIRYPEFPYWENERWDKAKQRRFDIRHTRDGADIVARMRYPSEVIALTRLSHMHEQDNEEKSYINSLPDTIRETTLKILPVLQAVDEKDALANPRPYRPNALPEDQIKGILHLSPILEGVIFSPQVSH